jgi:hypothetical protein
MNTDRWLVIAGFAITLVAAFLGPLLGVRYQHYLQNHPAPEPKQKAQPEVERSRVQTRVFWVPRVILWAFQSAAIFLAYREAVSPAPLTRISVVLIAVYAVVFVLCIFGGFLLNIYDHIQAAYDYAHFTGEVVRDELKRMIRR